MNTQNKEPNIRFNQFKELWKVVKLASISQKVKSKNINNTFENVLTNSAEFGIIPQRDFFDKDIANLKSLNGYYVVQPNDFVYNPRISNKAPVGPIKANFLNTTGVMSPLYYVFRTQNIDVFFLAKYFDSSYWHKFMKLNGDTGARSDRFAIKDSVFKEMPIPFPNIPEQSAIGSLFRTLDDLFASYKDNLANYQSLKTTMLSKMFPKAGQTVPEIRLDGFEGEWEIKKFKSISTKRGKSNSKGYDYPAYSVSNQSGLIPQSEQFEGSRLENLEKTSYKIVEPNEFAYNPARINVGSIAFNDLDETVIVSSLYVIFSLDKSINNNYALLFIKSPEFNKEVRRNTEGSVREYLFYENFANIRIPTPPSLEEQQAIGSYFSNLDNLINSYQEKISQLETLKKKLLQDMFI